MGTLTKAQTQTISITGTDVREVAANCWEEIIHIHKAYGRAFPYDEQKLHTDLGQLLLWDMTDQVSVQFYEQVNGENVERLSYNYLPQTDPQAVSTQPGQYPRYTTSPDWRVRVVARYNRQKPEEKVREFFDALGWRPSDPLRRSSTGKTEEHGALTHGRFGVKRAVYTDLPQTTRTDSKEREL